MIEALRIRDFALVDDLALEFRPGLSVLTGETGAGKSILLQALGLLLGDRASREAVRSGAEQARVEGVFLPAGAARERLEALLADAGIPWSPLDGDPLVISRTVSADGRSRAHVNGSAVPLGLLERIGGDLVEVSSQHQHQGLLREETHLALLDASLGPGAEPALHGFARAFEDWRRAEGEVRRLEGLEAEGRGRADYLRFQAEEIRSAALQPGEPERLRGERDLLLHAEKLLEAYGLAEAEAYTGPDSAMDRLSRAIRSVEGAVARDPAAPEILDLLQEAKAALEEAALRLRDRRTRLEVDPRRLEVLDDRLEVIRRLEKKHGAGVDVILATLGEIEAELWELEHRELALGEARKRLDTARKELGERATVLTLARKAGAAELEVRVGAELDALALGRSSFRVEILAAEPGPQGADHVRFLLAPNVGEEPRPLARIASGGELSRLLLALKNALRDSAVETLVFDEVDAGIGGTVADAVGDRLRSLAGSCQVLCITHLPQIASRGTHHLSVEKKVEAGRTVTRVRNLGPEERVEELARMLAGRNVTGAALEHARELAGRSAV